MYLKPRPYLILSPSIKISSPALLQGRGSDKHGAGFIPRPFLPFSFPDCVFQPFLLRILGSLLQEAPTYPPLCFSLPFSFLFYLFLGSDR